MPRFRWKRYLLWGLLFLPALALPLSLLAGHIWVNRQLQREFSIGKVRIFLASPRLGWDFEFTADSLRMVSPDFSAATGRIQVGAHIWQSLLSLSPSLKAVVDTVRVDLPPGKGKGGPGKIRFKDRKAAVFPALRIPIPFRVETGFLEVARAGRPLLGLGEVAAYSQGPKGAAVEWRRVEYHVAAAGPDSLAPGEKVGGGRVPMRLDGPFKASARWFGKRVRYQARFETGQGDHLHLQGERLKSDLARGRDSLALSIATLNRYDRLFPAKRGMPGRSPDITGLKVMAAFGLEAGPFASARVELNVPGPLRMGRLDLAARLALEESAGRLEVDGRGEAPDSRMRLQGRFTLPLGDTLDGEALLRAFSGEFSGFTRGVRIPIGKRWVLPGDFEFRRIRVAGGEARADIRSRDSTVLDLRVFRDSGGSPGGRSDPAGKPSWRFAFTGQASPTETWGRIWTDTNVNWKSAAVSGEFRPGELTVEVRGKGVTAYGAAADSLWARNVIRRRGYYLADSRLWYKDLTWPVQGEVLWTERRAERGSRGLRLRRHVSLSFRAKHARHGYLEYAQPRRKSMVVEARDLAVERLPVPRLEKALPYHPVVTGRFAWDREARSGEAGLRAAFDYAGKRLGVDLEAGWDARLLKVPVLEVALEDSRLRLGADLRLRGRQFHQLRQLRLEDVQGLSFEAERFEAAHLVSLFPKAGPLEGGTVNGRLAYADTLGFQGLYAVEGLALKPLSRHMEIPWLSVAGNGRDLVVAARTTSQKHPWLNDTLAVRVTDLLGERPGISLQAASAGGAEVSFEGEAPGFTSLRGRFAAGGNALLPGGAGTLKGLRLAGSLSMPLRKDPVGRLRIDSTVVEGRYAVSGLDTQTFRGELEVRGGRLLVTSFRAVDQGGRTLSGTAEAGLRKPLRLDAKLRGEALALQLAGLEKLVFQGVEASIRADSAGVNASAKAARTRFQSSRGAVAASGELENLVVTFAATGGVRGQEAIPALGVKARLRNFRVRHKIGFREIQRSIRTVKVDKRRKRIKPMDLNFSLEAVGAENRVETDFLRMFFTGDLSLKGVYPHTLLSGEVSALSGEIGQTSQAYDIRDFALKWQNATMEEGRILVEGEKKLRVDCRPETQRTCNVFIKLEGRLDEMAFTYDSDCGQTAGGEVIEPAALINSVSRGCYSGDYVSGAGGGGYGEAMFTFLEPAISDNLTQRVAKGTWGLIKTTRVSGIGSIVSKDTAAHAEPISVAVETREWRGLKGMASAGYHPEKKESYPWENRVAAEWRVPLEKVAADSGWKRRVRDRITLEASAETRPEDRLEEEEDRQVRRQVGIRYRYRFWNLW